MPRNQPRERLRPGRLTDKGPGDDRYHKRRDSRLGSGTDQNAGHFSVVTCENGSANVPCLSIPPSMETRSPSSTRASRDLLLRKALSDPPGGRICGGRVLHRSGSARRVRELLRPFVIPPHRSAYYRYTRKARPPDRSGADLFLAAKFDRAVHQMYSLRYGTVPSVGGWRARDTVENGTP